jgi:hypothetical protein
MESARPSRLSRVISRFRSPADVLLAARVLSWACVLPLLKRLMPIRSLVRLVCRHPRLAPDPQRDERVVVFARWATRLTRWRSGGNCLERGLIAYRFLLEGGAEPTLVIGMNPDLGAGVLGHAWVLLNGVPAGESEATVRQYVPVFAFAPDGSLIRSFPAAPEAPLSHTVRSW